MPAEASDGPPALLPDGSRSPSERPPDGLLHPPDLRFVLANERTFLAWTRTALALMAAGLALTQLLPPGAISVSLVGVPLIGLGMVIAWLSYERWKSVGAALRQGEEPSRTLLPRLLALTVVAGGGLVAVLSVVVGQG